jgi:hypothetical protein
MRVGLLHLGQSVDFVVSMTFLRSPVFAIFAIAGVFLLDEVSLLWRFRQFLKSLSHTQSHCARLRRRGPSRLPRGHKHVRRKRRLAASSLPENDLAIGAATDWLQEEAMQAELAAMRWPGLKRTRMRGPIAWAMVKRPTGQRSSEASRFESYPGAHSARRRGSVSGTGPASSRRCERPFRLVTESSRRDCADWGARWEPACPDHAGRRRA